MNKSYRLYLAGMISENQLYNILENEKVQLKNYFIENGLNPDDYNLEKILTEWSYEDIVTGGRKFLGKVGTAAAIATSAFGSPYARASELAAPSTTQAATQQADDTSIYEIQGKKVSKDLWNDIKSWQKQFGASEFDSKARANPSARKQAAQELIQKHQAEIDKHKWRSSSAATFKEPTDFFTLMDKGNLLFVQKTYAPTKQTPTTPQQTPTNKLRVSPKQSPLTLKQQAELENDKALRGIIGKKPKTAQGSGAYDIP